MLGLYDAICPYRVHVVHSGLAYRVSLLDLMPLAQAGTWVHSMYLQVSHQILGQIAAEVWEHHSKPGVLLAKLHPAKDIEITVREDFGGTTPEMLADRLEVLAASIRRQVTALREPQAEAA